MRQGSLVESQFKSKSVSKPCTVFEVAGDLHVPQAVNFDIDPDLVLDSYKFSLAFEIAIQRLELDQKFPHLGGNDREFGIARETADRNMGLSTYPVVALFIRIRWARQQSQRARARNIQWTTTAFV